MLDYDEIKTVHKLRLSLQKIASKRGKKNSIIRAYQSIVQLTFVTRKKIDEFIISKMNKIEPLF